MKKLARQLEKRRVALIKRYDEEDLHQLRVILRRMRSRLKGSGSKKLCHLRKDLGTLADNTNAARDWDTLETHASALLSLRQFESLVPWLREHQKAARESVLALLDSKLWSDTIANWKQQAPDTAKAVSGGDAGLETPLVHTLEQAAAARERALRQETDRAWHKLRIAIKELRYRLDDQPADERSGEVRQTLSICRQLQEELGTWHDTVVHRELLHSASPGDESLLALLDGMLVHEGEETLDRVRAMLVEPAIEDALSPGRH